MALTLSISVRLNVSATPLLFMSVGCCGVVNHTLAVKVAFAAQCYMYILSASSESAYHFQVLA